MYFLHALSKLIFLTFSQSILRLFVNGKAKTCLIWQCFQNVVEFLCILHKYNITPSTVYGEILDGMYFNVYEIDG